MSVLKMNFMWQRCRQIVLPIFQAQNSSCNIHCYSRNFASYSSEEENIILKMVNESDDKTLVRLGVSKSRIRNIVEWRKSEGKFNYLKDILSASGISERLANIFFNNILNASNPDTAKVKDNLGKKSTLKKMRGQILQPALADIIKNDMNSVTSLHLTMSAVSWCCIGRRDYSLQAWGHHSLDVQDDTKLHVPNIMEIAWSIVSKIPQADVYVMEGIPTTLRAGGSDPYNPKVISVNLQKSQLIAMIFALLNGRKNSHKYGKCNEEHFEGEHACEVDFQHRVYMLRSSLPARLFNTLVGSERVSTEQTVKEIFTESSAPHGIGALVPKCCISPRLQEHFYSQREGSREVMGRSLLLAMTFMEVCVYEQSKRLNNL